MKQTLEALVHFQKSIYKTTKSKLKGLRKQAKKARKKKKRTLHVDDARQQLEHVLSLFGKHIDTVAAREKGESFATADLVVDGTVLMEDVSPRLLVSLRKPAKYVRKATEELVKLHGGEFESIAGRASRLEEAIELAIHEANQTEVDECDVSEAAVGFLRGDAQQREPGL